jgi:hypothetical protein
MAKNEESPLKSLPNVTTLKNEMRQKVMNLMDLLAEVVEQRIQISIREDELKDQLEALQKEAATPGFRYGNLIFRVEQVAGRKTLDKMLLLENGCPISALNASYKEGKPSTRCTFKDLGEEE